MSRRLTGFLIALAALSSSALAAGGGINPDDAPPAWLRQAAAASAPVYRKGVPAVVLHHEQTVSVGDDGRVTTQTSYAVRVLTREGRGAARARAVYMTDTGKVREIRAWMLGAGGDVKRFDKDDAADVALAPNDVYNDVRAKVISAVDYAEIGSVFGYQTISEDKSVFTQSEWEFQGRHPTLVSRYAMTLPPNWRAEAVTFNHAKVEPTVSGSTYTWELRDLPPIEPEPGSPAVTNLAPRLAVSYFPAEGARRTPGRFFANWAEVSRWLSELHDPQAAPDDALALKARELTANAKTELERIQAVGRYVQNLQYISIQIGVGRGGGMKPHAATEVFGKSYGDCKDKATLMRAMLKALHITAYPVVIYSGDPTYVREEWASPQQFNHCIIAVKISDDTVAPAVVRHATLGRLLIFDATDENTPVGDLPDHEQGSLALVVAGDAGALLRMPVTPPEANRLEREAEVTLGADGTISAAVREKSTGQAAVGERRLFRRLSRSDYLKVVEGWLADGATGARVAKVEPADSQTEGRFALSVEFTANRYAQLMGNRLLIFKPAVVPRREALYLSEETRKHPIVLDAEAFNETIKVKLPEGFEIDEMPAPVKLDTPFGTYTSAYEIKDNQLFFTRSLVQPAATVPPAQYKELRDFFGRIRGSEQAPVVLAKK